MKNSNRDATTAYHEAGHVVVAWCLGFKALDASIIRDDDSSGHVTIEPEEPSTCDAIARGDRWDTSRFIAEKRAMILQAGDVAQRRYNSNSVRLSHSQDDLNKCRDLLRVFAPDVGKRDVEPHCLLMRNWTAHLIEQHWPLVKAVAEAFIERGVLYDTQIREVIRSADNEQSRMNVQPLLDMVQAIREWRKESDT